MPVFHIVEKAFPTVAVRTTRNRRSAEFLLSHFGPGFEIVEDLCSDIREKAVDVLSEYADTLRAELRSKS